MKNKAPTFELYSNSQQPNLRLLSRLELSFYPACEILFVTGILVGGRGWATGVLEKQGIGQREVEADISPPPPSHSLPGSGSGGAFVPSYFRSFRGVETEAALKVSEQRQERPAAG